MERKKIRLTADKNDKQETLKEGFLPLITLSFWQALIWRKELNNIFTHQIIILMDSGPKDIT